MITTNFKVTGREPELTQDRYHYYSAPIPTGCFEDEYGIIRPGDAMFPLAAPVSHNGTIYGEKEKKTSSNNYAYLTGIKVQLYRISEINVQYDYSIPACSL